MAIVATIVKIVPMMMRRKTIIHNFTQAAKIRAIRLSIEILTALWWAVVANCMSLPKPIHNVKWGKPSYGTWWTATAFAALIR